MAIKNLISACLTLAIWNNAIAATYYVDATNGDDANDGLSSVNAWQTLAEVNGASFQPGDVILLKRDEVWRETLRPPSDGTSGNPITYSAYGSGSYPVINGADIITGWSYYGSGTVYEAAVSNEAKVAVYNGNQMTRRQDQAIGDLIVNEFKWSAPNIYINVGGDPSSGTLEASQRPTVRIINKSWTIVEGLHLLYGDRGVFISDAPTDVTVRKNLIERPYHQGIYSVDTTNLIVHNNTVIGGTKDVANCKVGMLSLTSTNFYDNDVSFCIIGIQLSGNIASGSITNNHVHHIDYEGPDGCATVGIDCQGIELTGPGSGNQISGISIVGNTVHANGGACIATFESNNNTIGYNIAYDCGNEKLQGGIADWQNSEDNIFYNNTVYGSYNGFSAAGASSYINNIAMSSTIYGIDENTPGDPNTFNNNGVYDSGTANYHWTTPATGDVNEDPEFVDAARANFYLQASSPMVDAGVVIEGLTEEYIGAGVDIGAREGLFAAHQGLYLGVSQE